MRPKHIYMLERVDGTYRKVSRARANQAIESGQAEWVGVDGDEETNTVTYYASRRND